MSKPTDTPDLAKLHLEDEVEDLFASPESGTTTQKHTPLSHASSAQKQSQKAEAETRDARLRTELERIREINRVISGVTASLTKAKDNMETVNRTVNNASTLLATWTRILGQTEHNQRLILNPAWKGATQDLEDVESEELRRQQEVERRAAEETRRREEAQRKLEEEEKRKAVAPSVSGSRGRVRGARGTSTSSRGYVSIGGPRGRGAATATSTRGGVGVGRSNSVRGRGRGLS
nr:dash complex subunit duo1 [Quercus suber]